MKIKNNILSKFIKETCLNGEQTITEAKLNFDKSGLHLTVALPGNVVMVQGQLKATCFEDYTELGKIGIVHYAELLKVLGALKETVDITLEGNVLILKGGRTIEIPLADESLIKDINKTPNLTHDVTVKISKKVFEDIEKNNSFALGKGDATNVLFNVKGNSLTINYGTKYKFEDVIECSELKDNDKVVSVKLGEPLINAVHNLDGEFSIGLKSDYPVAINKVTEDYAVKILVAPKANTN